MSGPETETARDIRDRVRQYGANTSAADELIAALYDLVEARAAAVAPYREALVEWHQPMSNSRASCPKCHGYYPSHSKWCPVPALLSAPSPVREPRHVDPRDLPDSFYRRNPDYQGEPVIDSSPVREPEGLRVVGRKEWQFVHDEGNREALRELRAFAVQRGNVVFMVAEARSQWETLIDHIDRRLAATPERPADEPDRAAELAAYAAEYRRITEDPPK